MSQLQENLLGAEQLHEASDAAQPSYAQPAHFSHLQPSQPAAAHALPNIAYRLDAAHQQQQQQQHHLAPQYASQPPQPQHAYVHYAPEQQSHVRYPFSPQYAPAQAGIPVFPSAPAYPAPHAPFSPYASDLVRVERRQTHFSLHRDRVYATTYPVFMNSSLVLYLSADEWAASVDAINASLLWPRREKVVNAGALGVVALVVLLNLVVPASSSSWGLPLRWILVAGAFIAYMTVLRRLKARVNAQADAALRTESAKYETANPAERQGRLPCMLRWDGEHNLIISVAGGPVPQPMLMHFPQPYGTGGSVPMVVMPQQPPLPPQHPQYTAASEGAQQPSAFAHPSPQPYTYQREGQ